MIATLKKLALTAAPLLLAALSATAAQAQSPDYVRVRGISYAGTGCPAGTVSQNVASDYQAFTLLFDSFVAETGPNAPFSAKRKNCQINLDLDFPAGWSFTVFTVDYRGYVSLDGGVNALQQSQYYFQGQAQTGRLRTTMNGPTDRDYQIRDQLGVADQIWSPCGERRALNINAEVRLDSANNQRGRGVITLDSIDGSLKTTQRYGLAWRRCR